jgi:hypothetical protein
MSGDKLLEAPRLRSVSERLIAFLQAMPGAELIDELTDPRLKTVQKKADVLLADRTVVCEIKALETDTAHKINAILEPYRNTEHWPIFYGEWQVGRVLKHLPNGDELANEIAKAVTSAVRDQVRSANQQIRDTKTALSIPDAGGLLILHNESIDVLTPDLLAGEANREMNKKSKGGRAARFEHLQVAWLISEAHLVQTPVAPMKLSMMCYNSNLKRPDGLDGYVDALQERWAAFHGAPNFKGRDGVMGLPFLSAKQLAAAGDPRKRSELWTVQYHSNPYLRARSDEELFDWAREVANDLFPRMLKGAAPTPVDELRPKIERWAHFLEEIAHRGIDLRVWSPRVARDLKERGVSIEPQPPSESHQSSPEQAVQSGRFYQNRRIGTSYFCEEVSAGSCTMILLESRPPGLQCRFKQSLTWSWQYEEATEPSELERLTTLLAAFSRK